MQNRILEIDITRKTDLFQKSIDFLTVLDNYKNILHDNVKYKCNTCLKLNRYLQHWPNFAKLPIETLDYFNK